MVLAGLVALALASMAVYGITPAGRRTGEDLTGRGGSFVLGFWVRNWFYWFIAPVERLCLALHLTPFVFNALGVLLALVGLVFFARGALPAGGAMILASGIADVLDGQIARGRNLVSDMGAFLDSTLDRYAELAVFVGLAWHYADGWPLVVVVIALGGSLMVSYTRARGEGLGIFCKGGVMQRAERMLLLGFGSILDPTLSDALGRDTGFVLLVLLIIIAAGTLGTSVYRTFWISRALEDRRRAQEGSQ
jgi:CDP-diacylglycerol--glycerol-3-phosphate 3-phosphatidyltransferase